MGIYFYDRTVFGKIRRLKPSGRGELEITDVNNFYIAEGTMTYAILDGWWTDAGTFDSLLRANSLQSPRPVPIKCLPKMNTRRHRGLHVEDSGDRGRWVYWLEFHPSCSRLRKRLLDR